MKGRNGIRRFGCRLYVHRLS